MTRECVWMHAGKIACAFAVLALGLGEARADTWEFFETTDEGTTYLRDGQADPYRPDRLLTTNDATAHVNHDYANTPPTIEGFPFHLEMQAQDNPPMIVVGTQLFGLNDDGNPDTSDMWIKDDTLDVIVLRGNLVDPAQVSAFSPPVAMSITGQIQVTAVDPTYFPTMPLGVGDLLDFQWDFSDFDPSSACGFGMFTDWETWTAQANVVTFWIPEPAGLAMLAVGALPIITRRRRR